MGSALPVSATIEFLLEDLLAGLAVHCSAISDGMVGPGAADLHEKILNLGGEEISSTPLAGLALTCLGESPCEAIEDGRAWPVGLPWTSLLEMMTGGVILDAIPSNWEFECLRLGIPNVDTCEGETSELMENKTEGLVEEIYNSESETVNCTLGGEKQGVIEGKGDTKLTEGTEALTVS